MNRSLLLATALTVAPLAACSSDEAQTPTTVATSAEATTLPPATTSPTGSTSTPTTTSEVAGWQTIEVDEIDGQFAPPCCGSDWYGEPSPPLPADGAPLLDGDYFVRMEWPANPGDPLELHLYRFMECATLAEGTCEDMADPTAMGVDETTYSNLTLPLDDELRVVLFGFRGRDATASPASVGTGTDLAELAIAVEQSYLDVFVARSEDGESAEAIIADVRANPAEGFFPAADGSDQSVQFEFGEAPPLLFQAPFEYTTPPTPGRGTDILFVTSIAVRDGLVTLHVFAGFYP